MNGFILEACVDSVESALAASGGGADRLELCSNLVIGGTTPSPSLFAEIRKQTDIDIHALIRPRYGDFSYSNYEFNIIKNEIKTFCELGAEGIVLGILKPDGTLNIEQLSELMDLAGEMSVTLHRAFDVCNNPYEAMEQAIELGIETILTSGQKNVCTQGIELIKELVEQSAGRIQIQVGGGVDGKVIREVYHMTGAQVYHMSGKLLLDSPMTYRKDGVNMGLPSISEYIIWQTDEDRIREARQVLEELYGNKNEIFNEKQFKD
ncbi:MAG: copper homeostasis protein CutC [Lachnospiraceae bacterium]